MGRDPRQASELRRQVFGTTCSGCKAGSRRRVPMAPAQSRPAWEEDAAAVPAGIRPPPVHAVLFAADVGACGASLRTPWILLLWIPDMTQRGEKVRCPRTV
ncbi:hypothetical protein MTO96_018173 [Rhipicephalus appendiculatus]